MEELLRTLMAGADCRRRQVGAVITDAAGRIVGRGWNGLPSGSCRAGDCPRGLLSYEEQPAFVGYAASGCTALHAEMSALREAGPRATGGTCYVTCDPCPDCAGALQLAQVSVTVCPVSTPGGQSEPR